MDSVIQSRLHEIRARISSTAATCGRDPRTIKLVAVTKTVPASRIAEAVRAGAADFGENYVQEAQKKIEALADERISWHFIGHLQSNKAKYVVRYFDLVHSVDSLKLAKELDRRAAGIDKIQKILVQVNVSGEATKSGVEADKALELVTRIAPLKNLAVCGLMTMPPYFNAPEKVRPYFRALKSLQDLIRSRDIPHVNMEELSMGMTGDFEAAIEEGATMVRIGTAIFGERT
jgi:hypothetical protein